MTQSLQPTDILRYVLFKHPKEFNRVRLPEDLVKGKSSSLTLMSMCQETLPNPQKVYPLVWSFRQNILGIGSIRARSGNRAWDISRLFLGSSDEAQNCLARLEELSHLGEFSDPGQKGLRKTG